MTPEQIHIFVLIAIIILAGLLGGWGNKLLNAKDETGWAKSLILGLIASAAVPLFLKIVDSNLLYYVEGEYLDYFVFTGFCLVAASFSGRFLDSLSSQLISRLEQVEGKQAVHDELVGEMVNTNTAGVDAPSVDVEALPKDANAGARGLLMDDNGLQSILTSGKYTFYSEEGLSHMSGKSLSEVQNELQAMAAAGKAKSMTGLKGEKLWKPLK
jgi:uncharacterized membrane protein YeaQ/YmgE (transglycosylase-associated protein family)